MNLFRTAILLAAMTALFMGCGWLPGGAGGMFIALAIAAGMNLFAWWKSDKVVLRMYRARDGRQDPAHARWPMGVNRFRLRRVCASP